jgi:pSer/pThr/pTyr-binding forkhead associated (FHA) protein
MNYFLERTDLRQGGRLPLSSGAVSIGRSPGNTLVLSAEDRGVSAYHAVIYADPQRMLLQDLQSTNGTFVNGRQVQECVLGTGDEIGLGRSGPKFRIVTDGGSGINVNGININSINGNGINHINTVNDINDPNEINNVNAADPDPDLSGILEPKAPIDDGAGTRSARSRLYIIAAIIALAALLAAAVLLILIHILSYLTTPPTKTSTAGKDFFSSPSIPTEEPPEAAAPATSKSTSTPTQTSTTRDRIDAVLTRFGEDGYRAPPEMVERVEYYLKLYMGSMHGTIALWMERSRRYFPMIRATFSEKNVPIELAYVSMLESGFNTQAVSHAGAAGMWQFMPHTARRYGLRVDGGIDERTDPEKATRAAAAYFKDLIAIFGSRSSVLLCMAAYNAGEQRVINALKRIDDPVRDRDFWHLYRMGWLAKETNEYIPQVIALIIISDNPEEYGF